MRVAIIYDLRLVAWLPLGTGLLRGFRRLGHEARIFQPMEWCDAWLEDLLDLQPDLCVFLVYAGNWTDGPQDFLAQIRSRLPRARCVGVNFDDPYDLDGSLRIAPELDVVFTPERNALPVYEQHGINAHWIETYTDKTMHHPGPRQAPYYDVFFVGQVDHPPRMQFLPKLRAWCQERGLRYGEAAGRTRWVCGRKLTDVLHQTDILLELPRLEMSRASNKASVACSYSSPRLAIAGATATSVAVLNPKPDLQDRLPGAASAPLEEWRSLFEGLFPRGVDALRVARRKRVETAIRWPRFTCDGDAAAVRIAAQAGLR